MKESEYHSSGNEPYVFRVDRPEDLVGVHVDLMSAALRPGERLLYLLYAPIFQAKGTLKFGIRAQPASHAVAATTERILVTENRHEEGMDPTLHSIPNFRILCLEIGHALLLGWLAVHYVSPQSESSCVSLTFTSVGMDHVAGLVRAHRQYLYSGSGETPGDVGLTWKGVWERTPPPHLSLLQSLILDREMPLWFHRSREAWRTGPKRRKECLLTDGVTLRTTVGILQSEDEPRISQKRMAYGVNVCCVPLPTRHEEAH